MLRTKSFEFDYLVPLIVTMLSVAATLASFVYVKLSNEDKNQTLFEKSSLAMVDSLRSTMNAYALFTRGGDGLFRSSDDVTRDEWRTYVEHQELERDYPGIRGVSYTALIYGQEALADFVARVGATDWPNYRVAPPSDGPLFAPVLYLEPLTENRRLAIGFDVYSEPRRREAIDRAIATREPSLTARVTLVPDEATIGPDNAQAGVLLILPVFESDDETARATGLILSVFRIGDLMKSILEQGDEYYSESMTVSLYDAANSDPDHLMFDSATDDARQGTYSTMHHIEFFGRVWTLEAASTEQYEATVARRSHWTILLCGLAVTVMIGATTVGQSRRSKEAIENASALSDSNARIEVLMREVNHRSKNLLGLVQSIARQTATKDPLEFEKSFSNRLSALAKSQDLLVKNSWTNIALRELVISQLLYFESLVGTRIKLSGSDIPISSSSAQTIGMALHELATNAGKYGALSNDHGTISIDWSLDKINGENVFNMSWVERGGPTVSPPETLSFGSKVTVTIVKLSLSGEVETKFEPEGFSWVLTCPAENIQEADETDVRQVAK